MLIMAYIAFIGLGLYDGLLGVAWPSIRQTFHVSLDSVGLILAAGTTGYILSGLSSGRLSSDVGTGPLLLIGTLLRVVGMVGFALSPAWWGVVLSVLLVGLGGGSIDAGLNTYIATHHSLSRLNWLHASFGIGITLGPLLITAILGMGLSWRWGYSLVAVLHGALALVFALTLSRWQARPGTAQVSSGQPARTRARDTLALPAAWVGIGLFMVYTGTEVAAGQWTYTLLTESRSVSENIAGLWVGIYWGSFTVGRVLFGFAVDQINPLWLIRVGMLGAALGAALIWWNMANEVSYAGLALMGFSLAPIFPTLVSMTPSWLGADHAANAIGFQVGAAGLGAAALPGLAGVLAEHTSLEAIGPFLLAGSALMLALHEVASSASRQRSLA